MLCCAIHMYTEPTATLYISKGELAASKGRMLCLSLIRGISISAPRDQLPATFFLAGDEASAVDPRLCPETLCPVHSPPALSPVSIIHHGFRRNRLADHQPAVLFLQAQVSLQISSCGTVLRVYADTRLPAQDYQGTEFLPE